MILPPVAPPSPPPVDLLPLPVDLLPLPDLEPIIPLTMAALLPQTVSVFEEPEAQTIEPIIYSPDLVTRSSIALESSLLELDDGDAPPLEYSDIPEEPVYSVIDFDAILSEEGSSALPF